MDISGWKSEYHEMSTNDKFSAQFLPNLGFRWMFEASSQLIVASEESDSFEQVSSWYTAGADLAPISTRFLCSFVCSAERVLTNSPTEIPSAVPTASPESSEPTEIPTTGPSIKPSELPTVAPSMSNPTVSPSKTPSSAPVTTL